VRIDLDPDLWLFSRLSVRRHWRMLMLIVFVILLFVVSALIDTARNYPPLFSETIFLLLVIGCAPASAVAALEGEGILDSIRLCGRQPRRLLLGITVGLTWPYLLVAAGVHALDRLVFGGPTISLQLALLFAAALTSALFVLAWLPARGSPVAVLGSLMLLSLVAATTVVSHTWIVAQRYDRTTGIVTTGAGTLVCPWTPPTSTPRSISR
jgi:hypothetical protein